MIAHVVLFRPKAQLAEQERDLFFETLERALVNIPLIQRARVGRRVMFGRPYDEQNPHDFPFVAILEFDNEADVLAYLNHPAHRALGQQFYAASESALVFDYALMEGTHAREFLLPQ